MAETAVMAPLPTGAAPATALAHQWLAALLADDGEIPAPPDDVFADTASAQLFLTGQSAALLALLLDEPFRPRQATAIGHALVRADFVGSDVLGRSLRVLLLRLPEMLLRHPLAGTASASSLERRVAEVTEALANGYVRALRDRTLAEHEAVMRAELDAQRIISEQLRHQATHDPLTGLPNRAAVFDRLAAALESGRGTRAGLCYLDLDGFKEVNDRYGHEAGDDLLVQVARRIGETARSRGAVAGRIGGDEFVVVAEVSPGLSGMIALTAGLLAAVSRPVPLRIGPVRVSACAGIAERAAGAPAPATVIADADAALYRAKSRGPGSWAVYGAGPYGPRPRCPARP